jgi:hypothetical protein
MRRTGAGSSITSTIVVSVGGGSTIIISGWGVSCCVSAGSDAAGLSTDAIASKASRRTSDGHVNLFLLLIGVGFERRSASQRGLTKDDGFFSIDEYGPFAVKHRRELRLVGPGENASVPQWQRSKGFLVITAALELSTMPHRGTRRSDWRSGSPPITAWHM